MPHSAAKKKNDDSSPPNPDLLKLQFGGGGPAVCFSSSAGASLVMWNARLGEAQAGIKIAKRSINNLRYADDTTLMAESEKN